MLNRSTGDDRLAALVNVVVRVAQMHGSTVPLSDLVQLLPDGMTSEDVAEVFEVMSPGSGSYGLRDGLVVPSSDSSSQTKEFNLRLRHSIANTRVVQWLSKALGDSEARIVAVSGSTSYNAASPKDDVDLFCVTRPQRMWIFLAKGLLLIRASRVFRRPSVPIDMSCLMDEDYATSVFARDGGALFARDALVAEVVLGNDQYSSLLKSAPWMKRYFPKLYKIRSEPTGTKKIAESEASSWEKCVNLFLFATLGSYIRAKAIFHNNVLAKEGKNLSAFRARLGPDHLIYESTKYERLREIYQDIRPTPEEFRRASTSDELDSTFYSENKAQ
jgi:hypothetical protein